MKFPDAQRCNATLAYVDALLVAGRFDELEALTSGTRLAADAMRTAIAQYPEALGLRPNYDLPKAEIVAVSGSNPQEWAVYLHLWSRGGTRSDLTAELTLIDTPEGPYRVEIDDIHVL